jgi:hypothetical protein
LSFGANFNQGQNSQEKDRQEEKGGQEENREKESGQETVALIAGLPTNKNPAIRGGVKRQNGALRGP